MLNKLPNPFRTYRHVARYGEIVSVLIKFGFSDLIASIKLDRYLPMREIRRAKKPKASVHQMSRGDRIRGAFSELGPSFIKLGQFMSNRPDALPAEIISALRELEDSVAPFDSAEALRILETELSKPVEEIFKEFSKTPIASASIAQVHRATLFNGEYVAVKIQRPDIEKNITTDMEIMFELAGLIERHVQGAATINPVKICEEFKHNLGKEIDFTNEASHAERFGENFKGDTNIHVPIVYREFCTKRILTTEFIEGIKVSDSKALAAAGLDGGIIAERGTKLLLRQIFEHGYFHGDPHAGNIFVLKDNVICFVDFGIMGFLSPTLKEYIITVMLAIADRDPKKIVRILVEESQYSVIDINRLEYDVSELIGEYGTMSIKNLNVGELVTQLTKLIVTHNLRVMPGFFLLFKALDTMDRIGNTLDPEYRIVKHVEPFLRKHFNDRLNPLKSIHSVLMSAADIGHAVTQLPFTISDIIGIAKNGKLHIKFEHLGLEPMLNKHDQLVNRAVFAIIIGSIIMGSSFVVLSGIPPKIYGIPLIGFVGFLAAGIIGFSLLISMIWNKKL